MDVEITSFGYLHGDPPPAHLIIDLRHHFRDPHISPELRYLTARDQAVVDAVRGTPGIMPLIGSVIAAAEAYLSGPSAAATPLRIATGCAGGRHRAPAVAAELYAALVALGHSATITDRDLDKPVMQR